MVLLGHYWHIFEMWFALIFILMKQPGSLFHLPSSLFKLSELWDANFTFNYLKQIHFVSQYFENLLKQGT